MYVKICSEMAWTYLLDFEWFNFDHLCCGGVGGVGMKREAVPAGKWMLAFDLRTFCGL